MAAHIKINHNAGGFNLGDNRIQVRFAARATVKLEAEGWKLVGQAETLQLGNIRARKLTIENAKGEQRHILGYTIKAEQNKPFVLFVNNDGNLEWTRRPSNSMVKLPATLADGNMHQMFTITYVNPDGTHEVSTQCYDRRYTRLIAKQGEVGIGVTDPDYVNPISIIPALAIVAMMLAGVDMAIKTSRVAEVRADFTLFQRDEELRLQGVSYEDRMKELAPESA